MNTMNATQDDSNPKYWEEYLSYCRAEGTTPDLSDFFVWLDEQVFDDDEEAGTI